MWKVLAPFVAQKMTFETAQGLKKVIFKKKKWKIAEPTPLAAFERIQASDE